MQCEAEAKYCIYMPSSFGILQCSIAELCETHRCFGVLACSHGLVYAGATMAEQVLHLSDNTAPRRIVLLCHDVVIVE